MYEPEYCDNYYGYERYSIQLPILNDDCAYNYIVILLENDNVILGRHGVTEFGYELSKCYYDDDIKQVPFNKLNEPYKSLIIEKLLEEKQQGTNMENLIHLMPKSTNTMEQPIQTANYLREVEDIVIDIHHLPVNDKLLWNEVKELLKNNDLWDDKCGYYKHAKRIYVVTTEHYDFNILIKNKHLWANDITKEVVYPTSNSLHNYMYRPAFTENYFNTNESKWYLELPFEGDECKTYNYIIILLDNDNVILGRYGNAFWGLGCYYNNETKQVPFDKLDEPYKSLIIEKLLEETQQGINI